MKKLILFFAVFCCAKAYAQVYQEMPQYGYRANRMSFDSTLQIPTVCGVPNLKSVQFVTKKGAIAYDSCNAVFYTYSPKTQTWSAVSGGGGSTDTTSLSNRINLKLNISDTSNMLSKYLRKIDTATLSNRINLKVPYTGATQDVDLGAFKISAQSFQVEGTNGLGHIHFKHQSSDATATGQSTVLFANSNGDLKYKNAGKYYSTLKTQQTADRIYTFQNKSYTLADSSDLTAKLNSADTASLSNRINLKLNTTDTASLSNRINLKLNSADTASLSNRINLKLNITDTTVFQRKSLSANTIMANNTPSTANATAQSFKDTSGTYNETITFTGTTAPTGATNHSFRLTQVGKCVTLHIALVFATNGVGISAVQMTLPAGAPTPVQPAGLTGSIFNMYPVTANIVNSINQTILGVAVRGYLRNNTAANGFEIFLTFNTAVPGQVGVTVQYWTN